jgi:diaminopimelate decarboxylase
METIDNKLYFEDISAEKLVKKFGSPLYVYEHRKIIERSQDLQNFILYTPRKFLYACKANDNPDLMKIIKNEGFGIDAVSPGEVFRALDTGFEPGEILYTGNNTSNDEMTWLMDRDIMINMDSLSQLRRYGELENKRKKDEISIRINPGIGAGHHSHCITGGPKSKFGTYYDKIDKIKELTEKYNLKIIGMHQHIGSGILDVDIYKEAMNMIFNTAKQFPDLEFIDFGGGIGIPYAPEEKAIDMKKFGKEISDLFKGFCKDYGKKLRLILEPGRYIIAEAGTLLATVNTIKETPEHKFIGVDSGFNHLIRHAFYKAYHGIINASNVNDEKEFYAVAGNLCESGDLFSHGRDISKINEGDVIAITNAGAYGFSMSSNYNSRPRPAEVLVGAFEQSIIRRRETFEELRRGTNLEK